MIQAELLRICFELAAVARSKGNHPFGALLALDGRVLLTAENSVNSDHDLTRHAELNLVSEAARRLDPAILSAASSVYKYRTMRDVCRGHLLGRHPHRCLWLRGGDAGRNGRGKLRRPLPPPVWFWQQRR